MTSTMPSRGLLDEPGPALLDVAVAADSDCLPMVPHRAPRRAT